ncbi:MAG: hypothetical protein ACYDHX_05125 [Methanothrix sp.]
MRRDLPPGELLPARDLLDPGLFCQAALKAANRGHTDIKLRERVQVDKPKGARAGLDGRQDLEAYGQEGRNGEAGRALKLFW